MNIKYKVTLTAFERAELELITLQGKTSTRRIKRARILLMTDQRAHEDQEIAEALNVGTATISGKQLVAHVNEPKRGKPGVTAKED